MSARVPWWAKVAVKLGLGVIPVPYERVRRLLTRRRGEMEDTEYARETFLHFHRKHRHYSGGGTGGTLMEIGPGGSLLSGIFGKAAGFDRVILIDVGDFASADVSLYRRSASLLNESDRARFERALERRGDVVAALEEIGVAYYTEAVESLRAVESSCVDFSFSNAVLEHVGRRQFEPFWKEMSRVHKDRSFTVHQVDYKDHLGGSLNNLRFPHRYWESRWFRNQGFYTNRLRHSEVTAVMEAQGFSVVEQDLRQWETPPIPRARLSADFAHLSDGDLITSDALIVACKTDAAKY